MIVAMKPANKEEWLNELYSVEILDSPEEKEFIDLTKVVSLIMNTPMALVSNIYKERQWFKSRFGLKIQETHSDFAFCSNAILTPD